MHERAVQGYGESIMMELGRIVVKIAGREAGRYAVIVNKTDDSFVTITGPKSITGVKRRKCSIFHIEPTSEKFEISPDADDSTIERMWKDSDLIAKFGIQIPVRKRSEEKTKEKHSKERKR